MNCILCNNQKVFKKTEISSDIIIRHWNSDFRFDVTSEIGQIKSFELFECQSCNINFFSPIIPGSKKLYHHMEQFDWYYMPQKWEHKIALQDIKESEKILEIGSGFGNFIRMVTKEKGNVIEGIEINESAVLKSQQRGLPVKLIDLLKIAQEFPGHYDAVCSFQVLEHVSNPREFLENMCKLLKPGGKLLLGLPNADSFLKYQFNILDMPPHHMTRWSPSTLKILPNLFPIQLDHIKFEPLTDYHVYGYLGAYFSIIVKKFELNFLNKPKMINLLSKFLRQTRINKVLKGQSMYVSYTRK